jgi:transcription elongation factor Elf1
MAPMANSSARAMFRLATTVDSDVYLRTAMPDFDRNAEVRLPIGMVCPQCGNRQAHKVKNNTFCHDCGNYSKTEVTANKKNPSKVDVNITWID